MKSSCLVFKSSLSVISETYWQKTPAVCCVYIGEETELGKMQIYQMISELSILYKLVMYGL